MEHLRMGLLYRQGAVVEWTGHPGTWQIVWQRYTRREVLGPLQEYGLVPVGTKTECVAWADEADLYLQEAAPG